MVRIFFCGVHLYPLSLAVYTPPCSPREVPLESQCQGRQPVSPSSVREMPQIRLGIPFYFLQGSSRVRRYSFYVPLCNLHRGPPTVSSAAITLFPLHFQAVGEVGVHQWSDIMIFLQLDYVERRV
jgi:hypothetical protein